MLIVLLPFRADAGEGSGKEREEALRDRTVRELRAECKEQGIRGYSKLKKEDLIMRLTGTGIAAALCSVCQRFCRIHDGKSQPPAEYSV